MTHAQTWASCSVLQKELWKDYGIGQARLVIKIERPGLAWPGLAWPRKITQPLLHIQQKCCVSYDPFIRNCILESFSSMPTVTVQRKILLRQSTESLLQCRCCILKTFMSTISLRCNIDTFHFMSKTREKKKLSISNY